jgi:hypothetical protein
MSQENLDSINIELVVNAVQDGQRVWMHGDVEILINGIKPYSEGDIVDSELLFKSLISEGDFFIFSCCCGLPECGGWTKGINVIHQTDNTIWTDMDNDKKWIFDKAKMESDIEELKKEVLFYKKYFLNKEIEYVGVGYNW